MSPFLAELLGTMLLIILGDGVVANVVLNKTKGQNSGWIVITAGWAFAVTLAVYAVGTFSGAHLNPAVTIGLAAIGKLEWSAVPVYIVAQLLGAAYVDDWRLMYVNKDAIDEAAALAALQRFTIQGLHLTQARRCALLQRRTSQRLGENDAWLVATAESINADVVAADRAAFERLGERYLRFR
jgi:glycerol uptake facilitator-like aquaporin